MSVELTGSRPAAAPISYRVQDLEALNRVISGSAFEVIQPRPGLLDASVSHAKAGELSVDQGNINLPMRVRGSLDPHRYTIGLFKPGPEAAYNGHPVGSSTLLWFAPGGELDGHHREAHQWTAVTLPAEWMAAMAAAARRPRNVFSLVACRALRPEPDDLRDIQWAADAIVQGRTSNDGQVIDEGWLASSVRDSLSASYSGFDEPVGRETPHTIAQFRIARQAERHMRERLAEPIPIDELCITLRVSRRYLEYAFRSAFGISPSRYARLLRLHEVRRRLRQPGAETTVTHEALRMGFNHLSQFAIQYKKIFGESPSTTLGGDIACHRSQHR
jgi:AraC family ethanolamine operon transcriptional activator